MQPDVLMKLFQSSATTSCFNGFEAFEGTRLIIRVRF